MLIVISQFWIEKSGFRLRVAALNPLGGGGEDLGFDFALLRSTRDLGVQFLEYSWLPQCCQIPGSGTEHCGC
jgi:hypothetical protein